MDKLSLPCGDIPADQGSLSGVHFLVEYIAEYRAIFPRCVYYTPTAEKVETVQKNSTGELTPTRGIDTKK
jgi:hypothetical protein